MCTSKDAHPCLLPPAPRLTSPLPRAYPSRTTPPLPHGLHYSAGVSTHKIMPVAATARGGDTQPTPPPPPVSFSIASRMHLITRRRLWCLASYLPYLPDTTPAADEITWAYAFTHSLTHSLSECSRKRRSLLNVDACVLQARY